MDRHKRNRRWNVHRLQGRRFGTLVSVRQHSGLRWPDDPLHGAAEPEQGDGQRDQQAESKQRERIFDEVCKISFKMDDKIGSHSKSTFFGAHPGSMPVHQQHIFFVTNWNKKWWNRTKKFQKIMTLAQGNEDRCNELSFPKLFWIKFSIHNDPMKSIIG